MAGYAKLNLPKITEAIKTNDVIIDGLYSWEEYLVLKEQFGDRLIVLAIYSPPKQRYERLAKRTFRPLSIEDAKNRDRVEIENSNKAPPISMADFTILNTGSYDDLKNEYNKFMGWLNEA